MLCAEPAPAHLRSLRLNAPPSTPAGIEALTRLPLIELNFRSLGVGAADGLSFLRRMPTLRIIDLMCEPAAAKPPEMDLLIDTLAACTQLTELTTPRLITNAHLCRLLPSLTKLRLLRIYSSDLSGFVFGDLTFASTVPHLAHTLEELHLCLYHRGTPIPLTELRHLHTLQSLRRLHLRLPIPNCTLPAEYDRARGELDIRQPQTFRRDLWPHMVEAKVTITYSIG